MIGDRPAPGYILANFFVATWLSANLRMNGWLDIGCSLRSGSGIGDLGLFAAIGCGCFVGFACHAGLLTDA
jgi:hypothetical protein